MVVAAALSEWALLLGGIAVLVGSIGTAVSQVLTARSVRSDLTHIKGELRTENGMAVGELLDSWETQRIEAIPPADRTAAEDEHVEIIPPEPRSTTEAEEAGHPPG